MTFSHALKDSVFQKTKLIITHKCIQTRCFLRYFYELQLIKIRI